MPGCHVEQITPRDPGFLDIRAHGTRPGDRCPDCGRASRTVHSRYRRKPADLSSLGRRVGVSLCVRRFYCRNAKCSRRTFAERLPELVAPHARRTRRLAAVQVRIGVALGGNAGSKMLHHLAMPASPDTVLRLCRCLRRNPSRRWRGRLGHPQAMHLRHGRGGPGAPPMRQQPPAPSRTGRLQPSVQLARRFIALVRTCGVAGRRDGRAPADPGVELDAWLADARACSAPGIATFAAGLEVDGAAVRAALTEPWSSGQAEGQIHRIKLLKRQG